jgi:hypothetical protein
MPATTLVVQPRLFDIKEAPKYLSTSVWEIRELVNGVAGEKRTVGSGPKGPRAQPMRRINPTRSTGTEALDERRRGALPQDQLRIRWLTGKCLMFILCAITREQ